MDRLKKAWRRVQLPVLFAALVFVIMLSAFFVVFIFIGLLSYFGLLSNLEHRVLLIFFGIVSLIVGTSLAAVLSRLPLRSIREIMAAADKIADGDYSVRLELKGTEDFQNLSKKFNHMAQELGSVEMLRTDFVNNFSHEFKTPIVSIRGFAKMLQYDDMTEEERNEYLAIIVQESERLADLSANVLNLSKIEQQTILTDKIRLNFNEQLRLAIAMVDSKWADKEIEFQLDGAEVFLCGNAELLRQVWINLLDNAVKFSPRGGTVTISVRGEDGFVWVAIANQGEPIAPESRQRIFDKFYQGDTSHTTKGNGLGLTLARKILQLHGGEIWLERSDSDATVFQARLPAGA